MLRRAGSETESELPHRRAFAHHLSDTLKSLEGRFEVVTLPRLFPSSERVVGGALAVKAVRDPVRRRRFLAAIHLPPVIEDMYAGIRRAGNDEVYLSAVGKPFLLR